MSTKIDSKTNTLDDKPQKGFSLLNLLDDFAPSESIAAGNTRSQINRKSVSNIEISAKKYDSCDTIAVSYLLSTEVLKSESHINELISNKREESQVVQSVYYIQNKSTIFEGVVAKSREKISYEQMQKNYSIFALDDQISKELKRWENLSSISSHSHDPLSVCIKERTISSGKSIKKKSPSLNNTTTQTQTRTEINNAVVQVTDSISRIVMDKSTFFNGKKNRGTKSDSLKGGPLQLQSQDVALQCYAVPSVVTKATSVSRRKHKLLRSKGTQVKQHKINNRSCLSDTHENPNKLPSSQQPHHKAVPQATVVPAYLPQQSPMHRLPSSSPRNEISKSHHPCSVNSPLVHPPLHSRNHHHLFVPKVQNPLQVYLIENTVSSHSPRHEFVCRSPPQAAPIQSNLPLPPESRTRSSRCPPKLVRPTTIPLKPLKVLPSEKLQKKPPAIRNKKPIGNDYQCKQCSDLKRSVKTIFQKLCSIAAKPQDVCPSSLNFKNVNNNINHKNKKGNIQDKLQPSNFAQQIGTEFKIAAVCGDKVVKIFPIAIKEDDFQNMVVSLRNPIPTSLQTSKVNEPDLEDSNNIAVTKAEQVDTSAEITELPNTEIQKNNRNLKGNLTLPIEQYNTADFNKSNSNKNNSMDFNGKVIKHQEYSYNNGYHFKTCPQNNSNQSNGKSAKPIPYHYHYSCDCETCRQSNSFQNENIDFHGKISKPIEYYCNHVSDFGTCPHVQYNLMEFNRKVDKPNGYCYNNITELETYPQKNKCGHCPYHISNLKELDYSDYEDSEEYFSNFSSDYKDRIIYESETQSDFTSTDIRSTPQSSTTNESSDDMRFGGGCEGNYRNNRKPPKCGKYKTIRHDSALCRYNSAKFSQSKKFIGKKTKPLKKPAFQVYNTGPYGINGSNECETKSNERAIVKHDGTRIKLNKLKESARVTLGEDVFDCLELDNRIEYLGKDVDDESLPQSLRNFILKN